MGEILMINMQHLVIIWLKNDWLQVSGCEYLNVKLNSNFNFSHSFELSLALLSNFPTTHRAPHPATHPHNYVSSSSKLNLQYIYSLEK